jgi:hypothetical protein
MPILLKCKVDIAFYVPDSRHVSTWFYLCHPAQANYNFLVPARDEPTFPDQRAHGAEVGGQTAGEQARDRVALYLAQTALINKLLFLWKVTSGTSLLRSF